MRRVSFHIATALLLIACTDPTGARRPDGMPPLQTFQYPTSVVAGAFQAFPPSNPAGTLVGVRLTNRGTAPATIEHGACSVAVWLYRDPAARPVWQNFLPASSACIAIAYVQTIAPGASYDVGGSILGVQTLGDSLPGGRYYVRVAINHRDPNPESPAHLVVVDAGTIDLVR